MKNVIFIERGKDGFYWFNCKVGDMMIVANGETLADAKKDFKVAYEESSGAEYNEEDFQLKYDTASALQELEFLNIAAFAREVGINASLLRQYKKGQYISANQAEKIQIGINRIGQRMCSLSLK